jgi:iron complex transport system substrate-binding protein
VATAREGGGAFAKVSIEQVRAWDPDVILAADPALRAHIASDPQWGSTKAVLDQRIYVAPGLPFGWFETPPGVNRLIGVRWLASLLYPKLFPEDLRAVTRDFYKRFYHVDVTERQLDALLKPAALP